ncbi:MAG: response regulator transcription factor, partial [Chloroflexota bacterium]
MTDKNRIRVLIVDDHIMVHIGLGGMLEVYNDLDMVGEASSGEEAIRLCEALSPHVVLMDIAMPKMDGITAIGKILEKQPDISIIALTSYEDPDTINAAIEAGAMGYLLKNVSASELASAIRNAARGKPTLAPEATRALIASTRRRNRIGDDLTARELEVLALIARGLSNTEIGDELSVSPFTVKNHVSNILSKLNVRSRAEAA